MIPISLDMLTQSESHVYNAFKLPVLRRIEIKYKIIGIIELRFAAVNLMQLDTGEVCQPYQ
jgi:hypothetical protein